MRAARLLWTASASQAIIGLINAALGKWVWAAIWFCLAYAFSLIAKSFWSAWFEGEVRNLMVILEDSTNDMHASWKHLVREIEEIEASLDTKRDD